MTTGIYNDLLSSKETSEDEIQDILTNLLACAANASDSELLGKQASADSGADKTYEYFFNLSQVQMR